MSRWFLYHVLLTCGGMGAIGVGVSGPQLGYTWTAPFVYAGWYMMGVGAGLVISSVARRFLDTKAFSHDN